MDASQRGRGGAGIPRGGAARATGANGTALGGFSSVGGTPTTAGVAVSTGGVSRASTVNQATPTTLFVKLVPTIEPEPGSLSGQSDAFQHMCFQEPFQNFSPEELRCSDYSPTTIDYIRAKIPEHQEYLKSKLCELQPLQSQMKQLNQQMAPLQLTVKELRREKEVIDRFFNKRSGIVQMARREAEKKKNDELSAVVKKAEQDGRTQALKEVLFIHGIVLNQEQSVDAEMVKEKLIAHKAASESVRPAVLSKREDRVQHLIEQLSDAEVRQFISSHPTIKGIITINVKTKVGIEAEKMKASLEAEYEAKLKVYKLGLSGKLGQVNAAPSLSLSASAGQAGSSTKTGVSPGPAATPQGSTTKPTTTAAMNKSSSPNTFESSNTPPPMMAPAAKSLFPSITSPQLSITRPGNYSEVDKSFTAMRPSSEPPKTFTESTSVGLTTSTSIPKSPGAVTTPGDINTLGSRSSSVPRNIFGAPAAPSLFFRPSTPGPPPSSSKSLSLATNAFGNTSSFPPSNIFGTSSGVQTIFGSSSSTSLSSQASVSTLFGVRDSSSAFTPTSTPTPIFGGVGSETSKLFASKLLENTFDWSTITPNSFPPRGSVSTTASANKEVPGPELSGQKREREEDAGRHEDEVKKGRVDEVNKENK